MGVTTNPSVTNVPLPTLQGTAGLRSPLILAKSAIPFIGLSSGSVAANGVISAITALPLAYPHAYCYFPANSLSAAHAAGWYYCTFSTTGAGIAYLDTYASGIPSIPANPTAVSAGQGVFVGDIGEEFGLTFTVPANALGANGQLRISMSGQDTNNANNKTHAIRYSASGGTMVLQQVATTLLYHSAIFNIANQGATNKQIAAIVAANRVANTLTPQLLTVDTTAGTTVVLSIQRATATDNAIIENSLVELITDGT